MYGDEDQGGGGGGFTAGGIPLEGGGTPRRMRPHSVLPVTIRQLISAVPSGPDGSFKIDGREVTQITTVAAIRSIQESGANICYLMEDGTSVIEVRDWVSKGESDLIAQKRELRKEGMYARVVGFLKMYGDKKQISALHISPISDYNEVIHHSLEVIYAHLYNTKGPFAGRLDDPQARSPNPKSSTNRQNQNQQQHYQNFDQGQGDAEDMALKDQILHVIAENSGSMEGVSVDLIQETLGGIASSEQIHNALNLLCQDARIYPTTPGSSHFAMTSND